MCPTLLLVVCNVGLTDRVIGIMWLRKVFFLQIAKTMNRFLYAMSVGELFCFSISRSEFFHDLVCKFENNTNNTNTTNSKYFFLSVRKRYNTNNERIGYNIKAMRQSLCLVVYQLMANSFIYEFFLVFSIARQTLMRRTSLALKILYRLHWIHK